MPEIIENDKGEEFLLFETHKEAYEYLKQYAEKEGYDNYDIVEDNYEIDNGLLFIAYDAEGNEIDHYPLVGYKK